MLSNQKAGFLLLDTLSEIRVHCYQALCALVMTSSTEQSGSFHIDLINKDKLDYYPTKKFIILHNIEITFISVKNIKYRLMN